MSEFFDSDNPESRIERIEQELEELKQKKGHDPHPLSTLKIKNVRGSKRFHICILGERIKVVSYEDARTESEAKEIAVRCRDTVEYALRAIFADVMLP